MAGAAGKNLTKFELDKRVEAIEDAIDAGAISVAEIGKMTKLSIQNIVTVFKRSPETHRKHRVSKLILATQAESNLIGVLMNPKHPKNFEATKLFLNKYRIDLDDLLEKADDSSPEVEVTVTDNEGRKDQTIKINFSSQSKKSIEEED